MFECNAFQYYPDGINSITTSTMNELKSWKELGSMCQFLSVKANPTGDNFVLSTTSNGPIHTYWKIDDRTDIRYQNEVAAPTTEPPLIIKTAGESCDNVLNICEGTSLGTYNNGCRLEKCQTKSEADAQCHSEEGTTSCYITYNEAYNTCYTYSDVCS